MTTVMRWLFYVAAVVAFGYGLILIALYIALGRDHLPPGQVNTLVLIGLGITIGVTANVILIDRVIQTRTAQIDHRLTLIEADLRSQIAAAFHHIDLRLERQGVQLDENTGEISRAADSIALIPGLSPPMIAAGRRVARRLAGGDVREIDH